MTAHSSPLTLEDLLDNVRAFVEHNVTQYAVADTNNLKQLLRDANLSIPESLDGIASTEAFKNALWYEQFYYNLEGLEKFLILLEQREPSHIKNLLQNAITNLRFWRRWKALIGTDQLTYKDVFLPEYTTDDPSNDPFILITNDFLDKIRFERTESTIVSLKEFMDFENSIVHGVTAVGKTHICRFFALHTLINTSQHIYVVYCGQEPDAYFTKLEKAFEGRVTLMKAASFGMKALFDIFMTDSECQFHVIFDYPRNLEGEAREVRERLRELLNHCLSPALVQEHGTNKCTVTFCLFFNSALFEELSQQETFAAAPVYALCKWEFEDLLSLFDRHVEYAVEYAMRRAGIDINVAGTRAFYSQNSADNPFGSKMLRSMLYDDDVEKLAKHVDGKPGRMFEYLSNLLERHCHGNDPPDDKIASGLL